MASRSESETCDTLEEFVCNAMPGPGMPHSDEKRQGENEKNRAGLDLSIIARLRQMARDGDSVAMMIGELKARLGSNFIIPILEYMRAAFCLSLQEAKPIAALTRTEHREVMDEALLNELVMPAIEKHRSEWDVRCD
jgi:hypothetical protein